MTSDPPQEHETARHRLALASTLLLALATVATAWAGYQASRWHGQQARAQAAATAARVDAARLSGVANRKTQIDVAIFIQWVDARANHDAGLERFYRRRFTDRFDRAFDAWIGQRPFANPQAALSPFEMPQYVVAESRQVERMEAKAAASAARATADIQRADNYVLCVVLLASALFFAGLSTRMRTMRSEAVILGLGWVIFIGTVVWMATFPTSLAV